MPSKRRTFESEWAGQDGQRSVWGVWLMLDLRHRKVLVLGLGDTGLSMVRWLVRHGAEVNVADTRDHPPHGAALASELPQVRVTCGAWRASDFARVDMIAVSPGIDRRQPL